MKYTPRPWHTANTSGDQGLIIAENGANVAVSYDKRDAQVIALSPAMFDAILKLLTARKESTESFRRMSYSPEVQAVFDAVEDLAEEQG